MFWSRRVTCGVCNVSVPMAQARRTLKHQRAAVCRMCYERWKRSGRICWKCHTPVRGFQQDGLFTAAGALGHADCGGDRLAA